MLIMLAARSYRALTKVLLTKIIQAMNLLAIWIILFIHFNSNLLVTASSFGHHDQGTNNDRLALLAIKSQISHDPQGALSSWNDSHHFCQWQGVFCGARLHQRRRVTALYFDSIGLVGTLSPFVGNLSFLHHLYIYNNSLQGQIPPEIGNLFRLRSLVLGRNSFEGEIPANISRCFNLEELWLAWNNLTGAIPPELGLLSNLVKLVLDENRLTGKFLNIVMNMTSLQELSTDTNFFQGSIPDGIGQLKNLSFITLGNNELSGMIPSSFYNLSSLQTVNLELNQLEGSLRADAGLRFPQLIELSISHNYFQGLVPASLSNLTQLQTLGIYSNNFTGRFSFRGTNMPNLKTLEINENYLGKGEAGDLSFLQSLANCSQLQILECGGNNFGGSMPDFLGNWSTNLRAIDFKQNQITGSIPSSLFSIVNLEGLDLSENHLTGHLPPQIGQLTKLEIFRCMRNNLSGYIPYSIGNLPRLSELYLNNNNFEGMIPSSLGNCSSLLYLSLYHNNLTGSIPPHLFRAPMIIQIDLSENHLQGIIPMEIGQLRNLVTLDISANAFLGEVPSSLANCIGLTSLNAYGNFFSGSIPQSFKSLTSLRYLNLSHNRLSGHIPYFLSNFSLSDLDLSFNNLEGEVPINGVFANLSIVIVSGNPELCGGIPELHLPRCLADSPTRGFGRSRKLSLTVSLIIGVACLVVGVSVVSSIYLLYYRRKKNELSQESSMSEHFLKLSYDMILKATDGFSHGNLVGRGHFGSVYKGVLEPNSTVVAIKVISLEEQGATKSFLAECMMLREIRHRNLLKIVTACSSTDFQGNDFKALVYEFMSNGNLQQWIHVDQAMDDQDNHRQTLSLQQRLNIAIDVACALEYLHNGCLIPIIHCDLKPSNILLDDDMVAHVGDFGLARFQSNARASDSSSVALKGTVGYAAPEYGLGSVVSKEGDIYSYGIVLLEMMTAKRPTETLFEGGLNLHQYVKAALPDQLKNIIDPRLLDDNAGGRTAKQVENLAQDDQNFECIKAVTEIAVRCSAESPHNRMSIEDAIRELQSTRDIFVRTRHRHPIVFEEHELEVSAT